jgi:hypothetical protein
MGNTVACRVCGNTFDDDDKGFRIFGVIKRTGQPVWMKPVYDFDTKECLRKYVSPPQGRVTHPTLDTDFP